MSLNNASADALASTIVSNLGADPSALGQWKTICRAIFASLTANGSVTITANEITVNGSASTQVGPPAPLSLPLQ